MLQQPMRPDPYAIPALYDLEYQNQHDDVGFYVGLAAHAPGPILELGCGNGRIALPMARVGAVVHGVDRSADMLADLAAKVAEEPAGVRRRISWEEADYRELSPERRYARVYWPFNALHHCPSAADITRVLRMAYSALLPDGEVVLDCYLPDRSLYQRDPDARYEERHFTDPRDGGVLYSWEQSRWDEATRTHRVIYVYQREDGHQDRIVLDLHMYERAEIEAAIAAAGLQITWEAEEFNGAPIRPTSLKWVMHLRPA